MLDGVDAILEGGSSTICARGKHTHPKVVIAFNHAQVSDQQLRGFGCRLQLAHEGRGLLVQGPAPFNSLTRLRRGPRGGGLFNRLPGSARPLDAGRFLEGPLRSRLNLYLIDVFSFMENPE